VLAFADGLEVTSSLRIARFVVKAGGPGSTLRAMVRGRHGWRRARWPWLGLGGVTAVIAVVVVVAAVGQAGGRACAATVSAGGMVSGTST